MPIQMKDLISGEIYMVEALNLEGWGKFQIMTRDPDENINITTIKKFLFIYLSQTTDHTYIKLSENSIE